MYICLSLGIFCPNITLYLKHAFIYFPFLIEDLEHYFITSDSPGYSIDKQNRASFIKLDDDKYHVLPLSSKVALLFFRSDKREPIQYRIASPDVIKIINIAAISMKSQFVYCEDKEYLKDFIEKYF